MKTILTCLTFTIIFFSCKSNQEKIKPIVENITESVYASGTVKTKNQYQVFSTVGGIINKILVTENDLVKKGSPLMLVSNETSKISRKNALLAANYADLSSNEEKLADLKNNIALAQSKYSTVFDLPWFGAKKNLDKTCLHWWYYFRISYCTFGSWFGFSFNSINGCRFSYFA